MTVSNVEVPVVSMSRKAARSANCGQARHWSRLARREAK